MATISGVEEVSPGFFKVHESIGGHGGGGWDDRDWFADQGLDIRDYRVASLILEPAINCTVARIRRTYRRADDPDDEVSPPARGSGGTHIGDPNGGMFEVLLGRDEFITAVGGVSARVRSCSPTGNCVDRLELRTSAGRHFVVDALTGGYQGDKMGQKSELAPAGGYVVAGFWGRSGFSVDRLGLYLAPLRWRAAVHGAFPADFRSQWKSAGFEPYFGKFDWDGKGVPGIGRRLTFHGSGSLLFVTPCITDKKAVGLNMAGVKGCHHAE
eukprot:evm.model.scf_873.2 EVM.evm.TU.scf_873.2   scf_873:28539-29545(+)